MRISTPIVLLALSGLLATGGLARADVTPVLDGKAKTTLYQSQEAPRGASGTDPTDAAVAACAHPACLRIPFVYKPAKGITAALSVSSRNFYPVLTDIDVYLLQGSTVVASCPGFTSSVRYLSVPAASLKPGRTYTAVAYFSHSIGETMSLTVSLPGKPKPDSVHAASFNSTTTMCGT